ncbi:MAG: hypothetical protein KJP23_23990 [Deltaproteobacteria bacterium]|nr:hypothetical protein [Deltaproteobacteria bacterium]
MFLKRQKLLASLAVVGILMSAVVAFKLVARSDRHRLSYFQYGPAISEAGPRSGPPKTGKKQYLTSPQQKSTEAFDIAIVQKHSLSVTPGPEPRLDPLNTSTIASVEEAEYFEMMTAALAEDFPELDLSEMERIELFEGILQIRKSFERTRSLDRSAENAQAFQQLELERDAAIEQFENMVGMSFHEFMLRTPSTDGGIDRD